MSTRMSEFRQYKDKQNFFETDPAKRFDKYVRKFNRQTLVWICIFGISFAAIIVLVSLTFANSENIKISVDALHSERKDKTTLSDISVLNFALAAEDLEAAGYIVLINALSGLSGGTFTTKNGDILNGSNILSITKSLGGSETAHASALRNTYIPNLCASLSAENRVNCAPIQKCQYNFGLTVTNTSAGYVAALNLAMTMEQVGEGAYVQAMNLIKDSTIRTVAAGILAVESEHTAFFRYLLGMTPSPVNVVSALTVNQVLCAAAPFVSNADTCPPWNSRKC